MRATWLVLDPFCGCGTSINVAERLRRRWLGIDITHLAVSLIRSRLQESFPGTLAPYEVIGDPKDVASAEALANKDLDGRYQFQWWAVGLVGGRPAQDKKKGKDTGIDGFIRFYDDNSGKSKTIIVQVKSGNVKSGDIRGLKGVIERERAQLGAFITLKPATRDMQKEAVSAGFYESQFGSFPKLQILTIEELLDGKKCSTRIGTPPPSNAPNARPRRNNTIYFKRAPPPNKHASPAATSPTHRCPTTLQKKKKKLTPDAFHDGAAQGLGQAEPRRKRAFFNPKRGCFCPQCGG